MSVVCYTCFVFCQNVACSFIPSGPAWSFFKGRILYFQESLTFKDVSVDFTWEEAMQLESAQRDLCGRAMLENCSTLVSLDKHPHLQPSALWNSQVCLESPALVGHRLGECFSAPPSRWEVYREQRTWKEGH